MCVCVNKKNKVFQMRWIITLKSFRFIKPLEEFKMEKMYYLTAMDIFINNLSPL